MASEWLFIDWWHSATRSCSLNRFEIRVSGGKGQVDVLQGLGVILPDLQTGRPVGISQGQLLAGFRSRKDGCRVKDLSLRNFSGVKLRVSGFSVLVWPLSRFVAEIRLADGFRAGSHDLQVPDELDPVLQRLALRELDSLLRSQAVNHFLVEDGEKTFFLRVEHGFFFKRLKSSVHSQLLKVCGFFFSLFWTQQHFSLARIQETSLNSAFISQSPRSSEICQRNLVVSRSSSKRKHVIRGAKTKTPKSRCKKNKHSSLRSASHNSHFTEPVGKCERCEWIFYTLRRESEAVHTCESLIEFLNERSDYLPLEPERCSGYLVPNRAQN